jgi:hypothetical protein
VDCTNMPVVCSTINRQVCSGTAKTCGACLAGYVGADGDGNTLCMSVAVVAKSVAQVGESCTSNAGCITNSCPAVVAPSQRVCVDVNKVCPNSCGGKSKGTCVFTNQNAITVSECSVTDSFCQANCICKSGNY